MHLSRQYRSMFWPGQVTAASELDHGAQAENPGIVGLDTVGIISASARVQDVLDVEFEVQPTCRLPAIPGFKRNFVAACVRGECGGIYVGRTDTEGDFVQRARSEGSGVFEHQGDLIILERSPVIGDGRIEVDIPTLRRATFIGQPLQDRLIKAVAASLISQCLVWDTTGARDGRKCT